MGFSCLPPPIGKFQRQRFGEKRKEVFHSKAAQSGRMVVSCLRAHPLRKTQPPSAEPVQGCTQSSFSHLKTPFLGNCRQLLHDLPGGLACSWWQSGFRLLPGVCMWGWCCHQSCGFQGQKRSRKPRAHASSCGSKTRTRVSPLPQFKSPGPNFCTLRKGPDYPLRQITLSFKGVKP